MESPTHGPRRRIAVRMSWTDLLFLHWPVDAERLAPHLPEGLEIDTFHGFAWIGLVPFRMTDCAFLGFGWAPGLSNFYECNVRTYVRAEGLSGVWFFSLDAQNLLPVLGGRLKWKLNYVYSRFEVSHDDGKHDYRLARMRGPWPAGSTSIAWRTGDAIPTAVPGTLEHFLTERYWLFTRTKRGIFAGRIHHDPWPLRTATLERLEDSLVDAAGFPGLTGGSPASVLASTRIDVEGEPLVPIAMAKRL